jgi:Putative Flp pilus-assembly TadE/G-like
MMANRQTENGREAETRRQRGQALVFVTLSLLVLTGVVGLSIDMGYLRYTKRRLQTAADSAAVAGASELKDGNYQTAALNDSKSNGFEDGVNGVVVEAYNPPVDAPFAGKVNARNYVEVQVQQDAPTFFMRIFGVKKAPLKARAVAELGSSKGCVYSLALLGGITVNGTVNAPGCGVVDNAILSVGGGCITASSIGVVLNLLGGGCTIPQPILGIAPSADPLGYLTPPRVPNCNFPTTVNVNSNARNGNRPTILTPGVYCGGIRVQNTNTAPVTFQPGTYYITGGVGLQISGSGDVSGTGVMFYVTNGAPVNMNSTGNTSLTAPAVPPMPGVPGGMLIYQNPGDNQAATISGNLSLNGALYFPGARLTMGGNASSMYTIIVAQIIKFTGNVGIGSDYATLPEGSPVKAAVLVQ